MQYSRTERGVRPSKIGGGENIFFYIYFWVMVSGVAIWQLLYSMEETFKVKVEKHLRRLFPHSNNVDYADNFNLPVSNNIS